jgi:threonine/homoserine/homoserine lactone efflux protein
LASNPAGRTFAVSRAAAAGRQFRQIVYDGLCDQPAEPEKIAMLYLSLLPQFIDPQAGNVLVQSLALGFTQITISVTVNAIIAVTAGSIAVFLASRPMWLLLQRWLMGTVLAGLAVRMALESRR